MKIVIGGATGFIGGYVLRQCIADSTFTSVVALVRRKLVDVEDSKLEQIIMKDEDFLNYPDDVRKALEGCEATIWAIGSTKFPNDQVMRRVSIDYTYAAAKTLGEIAAVSGKTLQFVYVSGAFVEPDQAKKLWVKSEFRHTRLPKTQQGQGENKLYEASKANPALKATVVRPAGVLPKGSAFGSVLRPLGFTVRVEELSACLIDIAKNGSEKTLWVNQALVERGSEILNREK